MARKTRATMSGGAQDVGGPLWLVCSDHSDHHVIAKDMPAAMAAYHAIPEVAAATALNPADTEVNLAKKVAPHVFALPTALHGDGHGEGHEGGRK